MINSAITGVENSEKTNGFKDLMYKCFLSEIGIIVWTSLLSFGVGLWHAETGESARFSSDWFGRMLAGMTYVAVLSGVASRMAIAWNRAKTGRLTKDIHSIVAKSEAALSKREMLLEIDRKIEHFKQFLKRENYHNIRFPKLSSGNANSIGLEYTIRPVRDPKTNEPVIYETEMDLAYVVYIEGPAHIDVMNDERLKEYENSPIHEDEYAFCKFVNESWHLGFETFHTPYEFYLSGKVGHVEYGQTANEFILSSGLDDRFKDKVSVAKFHLDLEGNPMKGLGGCQVYEIYKDNDNNLYLSLSGSFPKLMYYTNPKETYTNSGWFFQIEDVRGYASGQVLKNIESSVLNELSMLNLQPKQIPWHSTKRYMYEPPN